MSDHAVSYPTHLSIRFLVLLFAETISSWTDTTAIQSLFSQSFPFQRKHRPQCSMFELSDHVKAAASVLEILILFVWSCQQSERLKAGGLDVRDFG